MTVRLACIGISNVAKLLKLLVSETEGTEFSSGSIHNLKLCIFDIVTQSDSWGVYLIIYEMDLMQGYD